MTYHVLIRDEAEPLLYRRIVEEDRPRAVVCEDGDLYRVVNLPLDEVCLTVDGERLCDYPQPHEHQ